MPTDIPYLKYIYVDKNGTWYCYKWQHESWHQQFYSLPITVEASFFCMDRLTIKGSPNKWSFSNKV